MRRGDDAAVGSSAAGRSRPPSAWRNLVWLLPVVYLGLAIWAVATGVMSLNDELSSGLEWFPALVAGLPWSIAVAVVGSLLPGSLHDLGLPDPVADALAVAVMSIGVLINLALLTRLALWVTRRPAPRWLSLPRRRRRPA